MSETFGGIGSAGDLGRAGLGEDERDLREAADRLLDVELHRLRLGQAVLGMRSACIAMFFSSSVGMNSWPSRVKQQQRDGEQHDGAGDDGQRRCRWRSRSSGA